MSRLLELFYLGAMSAACASPNNGTILRQTAAERTAPLPNAPADARASTSPILGKILFRNAELTVHASTSTNIILFSIRDRTGSLGRETLTEIELRERYPALHRLYEQAMALETSSLDARLDPRFIAPAAMRSAETIDGER